MIPVDMTVEEAERLRAEDPAEFERVMEEERARRGPRFRRRYTKTYERFKSFPEGAEATRELEERPERLYIRFDPEHKGTLLISEYVWRDGNVVAASLRIGPDWPGPIPESQAKDYPFGSNLLPGRKLRLYKLAHEEQGHFVLALSDPAYLDLLRSQENHRAMFDMAIGKAERSFYGRTDLSMRAAAQRFIPNQLKRDAQERKGIMERAADEQGKRSKFFFEEGR